MTVTINFDVAYENDATDDEVRAIVRKHGGTIVYYQRSGPSGGNPTYAVEAPTDEAAQAILGEMYGIDPNVPTPFEFADWDHYFVPNGTFDFHKPGTNASGTEHLSA